MSKGGSKFYQKGSKEDDGNEDYKRRDKVHLGATLRTRAQLVLRMKKSVSRRLQLGCVSNGRTFAMVKSLNEVASARPSVEK